MNLKAYLTIAPATSGTELGAPSGAERAKRRDVTGYDPRQVTPRVT